MINIQDGYICGFDHLLYLFWILPSSIPTGNQRQKLLWMEDGHWLSGKRSLASLLYA